MNTEQGMTAEDLINHYKNRDTPYLTTSEAATLLRNTKRTLERWRANGTGPVFRKNPQNPDTSARNQSVYYLFDDVLAFMNQVGFKSNVQVATDRGWAFASLDCLLEEHPFFINTQTGLIEAHAYMLDPDEFFDYDPNPQYELVWLSWLVALNRGWSSEQGALLKEKYQQLLRKEYAEALES